MIEYRKGDLFSVTEGLIAHGVNCQGVMGSGVAKIVREKYPHVFDQYFKRTVTANTSSCLLGTVQFVSTSDKDIFTGPSLVIANCFTQDFYGTNKRHVNYEAVAKCFEVLNLRSKLYTDKLINIPKIGAGLGGGDWNVIESIIKSECKDIDVVVWELA